MLNKRSAKKKKIELRFINEKYLTMYYVEKYDLCFK